MSLGSATPPKRAGSSDAPPSGLAHRARVPESGRAAGPPGRGGDRVRWATAGALLATALYAVVVARGSVAGLGGPDDTLYQAGLHQIMVTAFLHVAVALIACWLVLLRRRAGYALAAALGLFTLIVYALALSAPQQAGPPLLPAWVHGIGIAAAVVMAGGGVQRLAARGEG